MPQLSKATLRRDGWRKVKSLIPEAKGIAFDTCHKLYLLLDDEAIAAVEKWEYEIIQTDNVTVNAVKHYYEKSCGMRFVQSIRFDETGQIHFESLVEQGL